MSSESTVLNYMPLVVSSEFGKSAQFIIPVKIYKYIYTYMQKFHNRFTSVFYSVWSILGYL